MMRFAPCVALVVAIMFSTANRNTTATEKSAVITLPPQEYQKEQEVIRREFAMGMDDPDRMAGLLLFATAYQRHPYRFPVIGELEIYNQLTQEQVMQYYKTRYVPNNLTFVVVGDVDTQKVRQQLADLFKPYPEKSLQPVRSEEHTSELQSR